MVNILNIKDKEIKVSIRNYKNTNRVKMYFKQDVLNISKPRHVSNNSILKIIKDNEEKIYQQYLKIISIENTNMKHWYSGEKIMYKGEEFIINIECFKKNIISVKLDLDNNIFQIFLPKQIEEVEKKVYIEKALKKLFKQNTEAILNEKLPYWSNVTNIRYESFKVRDATSKFGSCVPAKKTLSFNLRLIMLPENVCNAIIVHELCHIKHPNHGEHFYDLVKKYIPDYDDIDKWLKNNGRAILI